MLQTQVEVQREAPRRHELRHQVEPDVAAAPRVTVSRGRRLVDPPVDPGYETAESPRTRRQVSTVFTTVVSMLGPSRPLGTLCRPLRSWIPTNLLPRRSRCNGRTFSSQTSRMRWLSNVSTPRTMRARPSRWGRYRGWPSSLHVHAMPPQPTLNPSTRADLNAVMYSLSLVLSFVLGGGSRYDWIASVLENSSEVHPI